MKKSIPLILMLAISVTACNKDQAPSQQPPQTTNDQLLARIGQLEEENKELKKELEQYKTTIEEPTPEEQTPSEDQPQAEQASATGDNMIGGQEKGAGTINLSTPGGEGSHVTLIVDPKTTIGSIGFFAENVEVDGNEPTKVYVDGQEKNILQLSNHSGHQGSLQLEENQLKPGTHNVEVIQEINGEQTFYRLLTYEVK